MCTHSLFPNVGVVSAKPKFLETGVVGLFRQSRQLSVLRCRIVNFGPAAAQGAVQANAIA